MPWLRLCGWLAVGTALAAALGQPDALAWRPDTATASPWTWWTASAVHLSSPHTTANLLALGAVAVLGWALHAGWPAVLAVLIAWPVGTAMLSIWPEVTAYRGLSGLLHGMLGVLWAHSLWFAARPWCYALFAGLVFKLLNERAWEAPVVFDAGWGFNVVAAAHLTGALAGMAVGLVVGAWALWRRPGAAIIQG